MTSMIFRRMTFPSSKGMLFSSTPEGELGSPSFGGLMAKHIIIEGIDGTGKDTQLQMLYTNVQTLGYMPQFLRTPTGGDDSQLDQFATTRYGDELRHCWEEIQNYGMDQSVAHLMTSPLFLADMISLDRKIWGTNAKTPGKLSPYDLDEKVDADVLQYRRMQNAEFDRTFVIQSRSWASTYAYQFNSSTVQKLALEAAEKLKKPDLWIWLDHPVEQTMKRIERRAKGQTGAGKTQQALYEKGDRLLKTQEAFDELFNLKWKEEYGPVVRINAHAYADMVHADIMHHIRKHVTL